MNWFNKFVNAISYNVSIPKAYGWFHIASIAVMLVFVLLFVFFAKKASDKQHKAILICTSIIMILFEVCKQLVTSYNPVTGWAYDWSSLPFQFCSVPMYLMLIIAFMKPSKVRQSMLNFLATFSLVAGLTVMFIPRHVFSNLLVLNIQTMVHHSAMVIIGVYLLVSGRVKASHKSILSATAVFLCILAVALSGNLIAHLFKNDIVNLFYISPYGVNYLPILSTIQASAPYYVFLLSYIVGFIILAYAVMLLTMGVNKYIEIDKAKKIEKSNEGKPHYKHNTRM